uniref:P2X purinoceptor n=1 Tax=Amazona collaria TaxID=241587 RepID=A0A8B9J018_9PSIT
MPAPRRCPPWAMQFFSYETPKSVVVRSWVVGATHRAVQLLILAYFIGWVFLHEKAYQVRDTVIESSVVTKVKGIGRYAGRVLDTADYGTSVFVVVTKQILTEQQEQGLCPEVRGCGGSGGGIGRTHGCSAGLLTGRCVPYNGTLRTCEIRGWLTGARGPRGCHPLPALRLREPPTGATSRPRPSRANLPPPGAGGDLGRCRFHPQLQPLCPILRLGDVVRLAGQDFRTLAATVSRAGDPGGGHSEGDVRHRRHRNARVPHVYATAVSPHRHARYHRCQDGTERRTLTKAFGIRFDVLVYGHAGKFGIVPTLINAVAGTVLCDIILLNFLKGAEHYKARKFEEVSGAGAAVGPLWGCHGAGSGNTGDVWGRMGGTRSGSAPDPCGSLAMGQGLTQGPPAAPQVPEVDMVPSPGSPTAPAPGGLGLCPRDKQSTDSGTFSLGH